ncbi:MAG TPA: aminoglycoside 6-adenylyltransferase [Thermomicrobiales bacterium]|nr:aminoglycoside 6-adenylyltransferase [Thermomicrobiales bacterium]
MTSPSHDRQPTPPRDHTELRRRIAEAVAADDRLVGLVDYGSSSEHREDRWSDVDCSLFIRPEDYPTFVADWQAWIAQFGPLLLSFVGDIGNYWSVIEGESFPIRIDFNFYPADDEHIAAMETWPNAPASVASMALVDKDRRLAPVVARMVGRDLGPLDMPERVDLVIANFWYYAVRTWCKLQRSPSWGVRFDISFIMHGNLMALLRLEAGKTDRWRAADAAANIERDISEARLARLNECIPGPDSASLAIALARTIRLGAEASAASAARYERPSWPRDLAERMMSLTAGELK